MRAPAGAFAAPDPARPARQAPAPDRDVLVAAAAEHGTLRLAQRPGIEPRGHHCLPVLHTADDELLLAAILISSTGNAEGWGI